MGTDISGVWECMLPNGTWVAFREINTEPSYTWFGILSGVRGPGPKVEAISFDPCDNDDDPEVVSRFWRTACLRYSMHDHTLASLLTIREANEIFSQTMVDEWGEEEAIAIGEHERVPYPGEIVESLWFDFNETTGQPAELPMNIPLREVMGLPADVGPEDDRFISRVRFLCAYDS